MFKNVTKRKTTGGEGTHQYIKVKDLHKITLS